jgi:hypothetical protein
MQSIWPDADQIQFERIRLLLLQPVGYRSFPKALSTVVNTPPRCWAWLHSILHPSKTRRPGMQARGSVASLAALGECVRI